METVGDQSTRPAPASVGSARLRYPLRSATKKKDEKPDIAVPTVSSASKRGRSSPAVSRSTSVLNVFGKDSAAKPPRRFSIPSKAGASPLRAPVGSITPISETQAKRLNMQEKCDTPLSEVSKSNTRRKFNVLSSVSYWLTQIKLSESASRHSISLGFFKLALESGCEPLDRVREELKSYIQRHNLVAEQEESIKDLLQCYNILEDLEKLKVSETCTKSPGEMARKLDKGSCNLTSNSKGRSSTCKSLNSDSFAATAKSNNKDNNSAGTRKKSVNNSAGLQKRQSTSANKCLNNMNTAKTLSNKDNNSAGTRKKSRKSRTELDDGNEKIKASLDNCPTESELMPTKEAMHEDKENMEIHLAVEEIEVS